MFHLLAAATTDVPIAPELKILVLIIPVVSQFVKKIPYVQAREDWLMPLVVVGLSVLLASLTLERVAILDGLYLGVACMGLYGVTKKVVNAKNGNGGSQ